MRHPGIPRPLQTRPSGTVDTLQRNEARVFGAAAFCLLQDDMSRAARRDYVVGAEPSHYSRPDLWEEGSTTNFFGTWSPLPRKPQWLVFIVGCFNPPCFSRWLQAQISLGDACHCL